MCNMSAGAFGSYCADLLAVLRNPNGMRSGQSSHSSSFKWTGSPKVLPPSRTVAGRTTTDYNRIQP
jgi:hypothetical protein